MPKRLSPEAEAIIASVIDEKFLSTQKATGEEVILEVHRRCRAAKLDGKPCAGSIRARLRAIDPKEKVLKREGKKAAHDKFGAVKGNFPGADAPLSVVQIDHTLLDIMMLDEEMRLPIGRPWLTLAGTLAKKVHALPGATFSNPKQRGEYKSEAKARMTLREFRRWLLNLIVGVYHNKVHDGIGCPPLARWNDGIMGNDRFRGIGLPEPIPNPRRLRLDFLPFIERTVQPEGIVWDKIWYRDPLLSQWVRADEGRRRRRFKVRRDPTDISKLYFLDPVLKDYVEIPYRDIGRPSISLWDYRAVETWLRQQGKAAENEQAIFDAYEDMHRITAEAARQTKRVRREQAKKRELGKHRAELTLDPPRPPPESPAKPKATRRRDGHLALVVNNQASDPPKPRPTSNDFDFDDAEIKRGVEEW